MTTEDETAGKMDEAVDLLSCLDISSRKLEEIAKHVSGKIKNHPKVNDLIRRLDASGLFGGQDGETNQVSKMQETIKKEHMVPELAELLGELSADPDIIENIEKHIIPLLFSD